VGINLDISELSPTQLSARRVLPPVRPVLQLRARRTHSRELSPSSLLPTPYSLLPTPYSNNIFREGQDDAGLQRAEVEEVGLDLGRGTEAGEGLVDFAAVMG
jgi:hypothetical protein